MRILSSTALLLIAALAVSGCESSKEKAERYYQSGMQLLAEGDVDRALVQFRNVFKYDGLHKEARKAYADTERALGNESEAYGQYLRLIEQYPDTAEVRLTLAEMAILNGQWSEAERHGAEAIRLAPDAPGVAAVKAALDYRKAVLDGDAAAQAEAAAAAEAVLQDNPDSQVALRVAIDWQARGDEPAAALPALDHAIELDPETLALQVQKLQLLARQGDTEAVGAQLKRMVVQFPDNLQIREAMIGWYRDQGDVDGAEAFLRVLAGDPTGPVDGHVTVIRFLQATRGIEAARAEIEALARANEGAAGEGAGGGAAVNPGNADFYRSMLAGLDFDAGDRAGAIAAVESILQGAAPGDRTRRIKTMLAQMLETTGNRVGARARVEEVLAEDPAQVDALKLRARWLIDADDPDAAILDLRTALGQAPRDPALLTLLAQAYQRAGNQDLAGEQLALAAEASGAAPEESLRYARFLLAQGRTKPADTVLTDARRANPGHVGVLSALGGLSLQAQDWERLADIVATLRRLDTPPARSAADELEAAQLQAQGRGAESIARLQELAARGEDPSAPARLVQAWVQAGQPEQAREWLDAQLQEHPQDIGLHLLSGNLYALAGDRAAAEADFRAARAINPAAEQPAQLLYGLLLTSGRADEAGALLDEALQQMPNSVALRWFKASELQAAGDIDGAIAIYEALYDEDSANLLAANNLASLLTSFRDDADTLARATAIARRLKDTREPAFQDTWGWIAHLNGDNAEALRYLEPAAQAQPQDALTQLHLGMVYLALQRVEDARRQLTKALDLAGDDPLPPFQAAREELARLPPAP